MKRTPNTDPKTPPYGPQSDNAITISERIAGMQQTVKFRIPFSHVQLHRVPFKGIGNMLRELNLNGPAVYGIVMSSELEDVHSSVYVGSTGNGEQRFQQHQYDLRFTPTAHTVYVLTTTSFEANSAHMRFVEGVLNRVTGDQPNTEVISQDVPAFEMSIHDENIVKVIIKDAISLLSAAGYPMNAHSSLILKNIPFLTENDVCNVTEVDDVGATSADMEDVLWAFEAPVGVLKTFEMSGAMLHSGRFIVFPGSHFRVSENHKLAPNLQATRDHLEASGYLKPTEADDGRLELVFPFEFASPQQAVHAMLKSNKPVEGYWSQTPMGRFSTPSEL